MKVYIMRHGTTVWNEQGRTQGRSQNRLSARGKMEVQNAAKKFEKVKPDVIFCSPLFRTIQTANLMNLHKVRVIKNDLITEVDQGIFTGRQKGSFSKEEQQLRAKRSAECGMENFDELKLRCQKFLEFLHLKPYKTILVVTHNAVASVLEDLLNNKNMDYSHIKGWNFKNAEIKSFNL